MSLYVRGVVALVGIISAAGGGVKIVPPDPPVVGQVRHAFLCSDNRRGMVSKFSAEGKLVWQVPAPGARDIWALPNKNILFSYYSRTECGVKEVTPDKKVVFQYKLPVRCEVHACQRLPNGNTMIGACGPCRLIEVNPAGKVVKEVRLKSDHKSAHLHLRLARQLKNGNYLVCHVGDHVVREYDPKGKVIAEFRAGQCCAAIRLDNGNTLISGGSKCTVTEVDPKGKVVWQITKEDFPQLGVDWISGLQRLPNGNTVVCNWLGHGKLGKGVPIFEVTRDKKIVWMFTDSKTTKAVSCVQLLDVEGDATKGEILR